MAEILEVISTVFQFIWEHSFALNILLAITIVFFERRDPKTIWAWLLVLYFIPVLGFVFYLFLGADMHKRKMFKVKEIEDISDLKQVFFKNYRCDTVTRDDTHLQELLELVNRHTYTIELIAKHMSNSGQSTLEMIDLLKKEGINV